MGGGRGGGGEEKAGNGCQVDGMVVRRKGQAGNFSLLENIVMFYQGKKLTH